MKILLFAGSLRKDSLNKKLLAQIQNILTEDKNLEVQILDLQVLNFPVYDGDIEAQGIPENVSKMGQAISQADGVIISSPEYNGSIASPLKNAIDWVSRLRPVPWEKKNVLLTGASPGYFGTIRALGHTLAPFQALGSYVYPQNFALPKAGEAFEVDGKFKDPSVEKRLRELLKNYIQYLSK